MGKSDLRFVRTQVDSLHKNKTVRSALNNSSVDSILKTLSGNYTYEIGYIPNGYEGRPDLISNVYYGTPDLVWILMYANGITDPFEGFYLNRKIKIPTI
tara:strand:+ start:1462 stop:1758 length:297 start_codon:yes stop_codon:yes gene_type:complete